MVIVKIMGGLGNQMFQYALAQRLKYEGREVLLDCSYFSHIPEGDTARKNFLIKMSIDIGEAGARDIAKMKKEESFFYRILFKLGIRQKSVLVEKESRFYGEVFTKETAYLIGYWQSVRYFIGVEATLKKIFDFSKQVVRKEDQNLLSQIRKTNCAVSIHIRGGDYQKAENVSVFGGICTKEYYAGAIKYLTGIVDNCQFFVFTNDGPLAEEILPIEDSAYTIVDEREEREAMVDLYLMSQCKYNIIANSTFGWWGAWLNDNQEKIVIAPREWSKNKEGKEIYPTDWTLCDSEGNIVFV